MAAFSDDFNRANSTDLGPGWVEVSGDWSIVSGQLSPGAAGGTIILRAAAAMASSDHYAQVTIAATTSASQGVWCRGNTNISSGYLWRNDGSSWDLFAVVGGSFLSIGSYAAPAAPGDVARVQAVSSTIKGYVNGVQRVSVTNTDVATGTSVGIRSESVGALRFDDFTAADVTAGVSLALAFAAASETAQTLSTAKAGSFGSAAATETAQPLIGVKTVALEAALEAATVQAIAGAKAVSLPTAMQAETAQPFAATVTRSLDAATAVDVGRPLTVAKSAILAPALEASTARPLAAAGADGDVDVVVGTPYSTSYSTSAPHADSWKAGAPH